MFSGRKMRRQGGRICLTKCISTSLFVFLKHPIVQNYVYKILEVERHETKFIKGPPLQKKEVQSL